MFKNLRELENTMCSVMKRIIKSDNPISTICSLSIDENNALKECDNKKYIDGLLSWQDENGNYHFDPYPNVYVNEDGLKFIKENSSFAIIKTKIFEVLKGTLGFVLGIIGTLIAEIVLIAITNPEAIEEFLSYIQYK